MSKFSTQSQSRRKSESMIQKSMFHFVPSILMGLGLSVMIISQFLAEQSPQSDSFTTFLFAAVSNLAFLVYLQKFINHKGQSDNSGYVFFYLYSVYVLYVISIQQSFLNISYLVFFQVLLYRLAVRLRYGGIPILSFLFNALAIYLISIDMTASILTLVYFVVQLVENNYLSRFNKQAELMALHYGWLVFVGYLIFLAIILKS